MPNIVLHRIRYKQPRRTGIADGTIGDGERPNASDLQLASTVRLLLTIADVRPLIDGRPCADLALRLFPSVDGELPTGSLPR